MPSVEDTGAVGSLTGGGVDTGGGASITELAAGVVETAVDSSASGSWSVALAIYVWSADETVPSPEVAGALCGVGAGVGSDGDGGDGFTTGVSTGGGDTAGISAGGCGDPAGFIEGVTEPSLPLPEGCVSEAVDEPGGGSVVVEAVPSLCGSDVLEEVLPTPCGSRYEEFDFVNDWKSACSERSCT